MPVRRLRCAIAGDTLATTVNADVAIVRCDTNARRTHSATDTCAASTGTDTQCSDCAENAGRVACTYE
jgi:hypothetical protein